MNMVNTLVTYRHRVEGDRRKSPLGSENCQIIPVECIITGYIKYMAGPKYQK